MNTDIRANTCSVVVDDGLFAQTLTKSSCSVLQLLVTDVSANACYKLSRVSGKLFL